MSLVFRILINCPVFMANVFQFIVFFYDNFLCLKILSHDVVEISVLEIEFSYIVSWFENS